MIERLLQYYCANGPSSILDLGCGKGLLVDALRAQGHDAYGCDIVWDASDFEGGAAEKSYLRTIEMQPYRLPFDDNQFDFVVSADVLEHVMDYESTFAEIHRVLKPGGISLHTFPSRYAFIEPHVFVPLATVIRSKPWLYLWAILGVRNEFQHGQDIREIVRLNYNYLKSHTNYLTGREIMKHAHLFADARFCEEVFFKQTPSTPRRQSLKKRLALQLFGENVVGRLWFIFKSAKALYLKK